MQYFSYRDGGQYGEDTIEQTSFGWFSQSGGQADEVTPTLQKAIRDILYGYENLRKRPGSED